MGAEFILMYNLVLYRPNSTAVIAQYNSQVICEKVLETQKDKNDVWRYDCLLTHVIKNK